MSNKKYIYNPEQANYFITYGVRCIGTGKHYTTNKPFWIFNYNECQEAYSIWNNRTR